jgi:RimJ/RimL family protein N-acetyltransferase
LDNIVHTFHTKDGLQITVRPLQAEDTRLLIDLFAHMGLESRFLRFNTSLAEPDPERIQQEAQHIADVKRPENDGWLAFANLPDQPNAPVAGIRYLHTGSGSAEISLAVRDDMQNKGIGTALITFLFEQAKASGITKLEALVQLDNRPLWKILNKLPLPIQRNTDGSYVHLEIEL